MIIAIKLVHLMNIAKKIIGEETPEPLDETIEVDTTNITVTFKYAFSSHEELQRYLDIIYALNKFIEELKSLDKQEK